MKTLKLPILTFLFTWFLCGYTYAMAYPSFVDNQQKKDGIIETTRYKNDRVNDNWREQKKDDEKDKDNYADDHQYGGGYSADRGLNTHLPIDNHLWFLIIAGVVIGGRVISKKGKLTSAK